MSKNHVPLKLINFIKSLIQRIFNLLKKRYFIMYSAIQNLLKQNKTLVISEWILLLNLLVFIPIIAGIFTGFISASLHDYRGIKKLSSYTPAVPTKIYDIKGRLISEVFREKRELIDFEDIPQNLINAIIATEDNNFYNHLGINIKGIIRALIVDIKNLSFKEGGSSITQQLAKLLFTHREKKISRKIKEFWYSLQIERKFTKNEILTKYFNLIYFGHGAYGIEAASELYFGKHAKDINLGEAALLAALPSAPNKYSPIKHPSKSMIRHRQILAKMERIGFITHKMAIKAYTDFWDDFYRRSISPDITMYGTKQDLAPYFTEYIRKRLIKEFGAEQAYSAGYNVYTTLDIDQQRTARKALFEQLKKQDHIFTKRHYYYFSIFDEKIFDTIDLLSNIFNLNIDIAGAKFQGRFDRAIEKENIDDELEIFSLLFGINKLKYFHDKYKYIKEELGKDMHVEGAIISIEPKTGGIRVMVGGSGFNAHNQLNRAMQTYRQLGSAFKPFVYGAAIDSKKYTPASIFWDRPLVFADEDSSWIPANYGGKYRGKLTLRRALALSINMVAIQLLDKIGYDSVINFASKLMHINNKKRFNKSLSLALGSVSVSPFEATRAYAILANQGRALIPYSIRFIIDSKGRIIKNYELKNKQQLEYMEKNNTIHVIPETTAWLLTDMLRDVVRSGTASIVFSNFGFNKPAAGKTGTTNNWHDAWFCGFVPNMACAVWIGFDKFALSLGRGQTGATTAAPVWLKYIASISSSNKFKMPKGITEQDICIESGMLPGTNCTSVKREYFIEGTEPKEICTTCDQTKNFIKLKRKEDLLYENITNSLIFSDEDLLFDE